MSRDFFFSASPSPSPWVLVTCFLGCCRISGQMTLRDALQKTTYFPLTISSFPVLAGMVSICHHQFLR